MAPGRVRRLMVLLAQLLAISAALYLLRLMGRIGDVVGIVLGLAMAVGPISGVAYLRKKRVQAFFQAYANFPDEFKPELRAVLSEVRAARRAARRQTRDVRAELRSLKPLVKAIDRDITALIKLREAAGSGRRPATAVRVRPDPSGCGCAETTTVVLDRALLNLLHARVYARGRNLMSVL